GLGMEVTDLWAASKNIPNAFSAWSMVFSARSRNSAGTSSFGSVMAHPPVWLWITTLPERWRTGFDSGSRPVSLIQRWRPLGRPPAAVILRPSAKFRLHSDQAP